MARLWRLGALDFQAPSPSTPTPSPDAGKNAIAGYDPKAVWIALRNIGYSDAKIEKFLTFPFDERFLYYETEAKLLNRPRPELAANRIENEFLLTVPEPRKESETRPIFSTTLANLHVHERGSVLFPRETRESFSDEQYGNIAESAWRTLGKHFGLTAALTDRDEAVDSV